ncbi:hypothetical protein MMC08_001104 [Hypocenomyce scalaris]|nr:hypothetical protein [Hypocenomyce scalaris]
MTNSSTIPAGETGEAIPFSKATFMTMAAFTAVAWYNVIELNIQVFMTFKRHRGLYFWSLLISSYGCALHALGFVLKFFVLSAPMWLSVTIITIGWYCMVTGQAVVLYSRLHLVVRERAILRGVLTMIIVDAFCFLIPTTVLTYGENVTTEARFVHAFRPMEPIQMTFFCIQEFIISGIYVYSTIRLLRPVYHGRTRSVMLQLIWINLIIIGLDILLLTMEYRDNYELEATLKPMVYSIKLKLEFSVLNQLMTLANSSVNNATNLAIDEEPPPFAEPKNRSKSLSYLTRYVHPGRNSRANSGRSGARTPNIRSDSAASHNTRASSFTTNNANHLKWVPSLDRNCVVKAEHIEVIPDPHNVFTNPAACFRPEAARWPPHDGLGGIPDSPEPLSPALTGSTLARCDSGQGGRSRYSRPDLTFPRPPPLGVLRSNRPSVSDWALGPDVDCDSPTSSEIQLDPYSGPATGTASVRTGKGIGHRNTGMDFMTSALHE